MSTDLQNRAFSFIRDRIEQVESSPSYAEIAEHLGSSKSRVHRFVNALIDEGLLKRTGAKVRNLALAGSIDLRPVTTEALRAELARRGVTFDALETPRAFGRGRPCAAHGCDVQVRPGMLMCREHWFQVRKPTRDAIMAAWSARDMQAYQEAVEAARDQVGGFHRVVERVA